MKKEIEKQFDYVFTDAKSRNATIGIQFKSGIFRDGFKVECMNGDEIVSFSFMESETKKFVLVDLREVEAIFSDADIFG